MFEHLPRWLGSMLRNVRAGHSKLVIVQPELQVGETVIDLGSPAFGDGGRLPVRFTADGDGVSPPLVWGEVPVGTASLALIVEDPDAPAMQPLVHALIWKLPADERALAEGAIAPDGDGQADGRDIGRNSLIGEGWLPPDPPSGHGSHDYVFQLFAISETPALVGNPGRADLLEALKGRVLGAGMLVGTYSRGEEAPLTTQGVAGASPA